MLGHIWVFSSDFLVIVEKDNIWDTHLLLWLWWSKEHWCSSSRNGGGLEVGGWRVRWGVEEGGDNLDAGAHRDSTVAHLLVGIVGGELGWQCCPSKLFLIQNGKGPRRKENKYSLYNFRPPIHPFKYASSDALQCTSPAVPLYIKLFNFQSLEFSGWVRRKVLRYKGWKELVEKY